MVSTSTAKLNEDPIPIPEELFGQLRQAAPPDAVEIAKTLPEVQRARLALFLYNRNHLHELGLRIASSCGLQALFEAGGRLGEMIYQQSRDAEATLSQQQLPPGVRPRKPITLAGGKQDSLQRQSR